MRAEQQPEAIFRDLFDDAPDATVVTDAAGVIVLANRRAKDLFGYSLDELIGQPVHMLVPERVRQAIPERQAAYMAHPKPFSADDLLRKVRDILDGDT